MVRNAVHHGLSTRRVAERYGIGVRSRGCDIKRSHRLSAVHMDWYYNSALNRRVCAVLDDASRMILAAGEFESATAENSIRLLDEAYHRYLHIAFSKNYLWTERISPFRR